MIIKKYCLISYNYHTIIELPSHSININIPKAIMIFLDFISPWMGAAALGSGSAIMAKE